MYKFAIVFVWLVTHSLAAQAQTTTVEQQVDAYLYSIAAYQQQGNYDKAFALIATGQTLLEKDIAIVDKLNIITYMADVLIATQAVYAAKNLLTQGQTYLAQLETVPEEQRHAITLRLLSLEANIASLEFDYAQAANLYQQILPLTSKESLIQTHINLARVYLEQQAYQQGLDELANIDLDSLAILPTEQQHFYTLAMGELSLQLAQRLQKPLRFLYPLFKNIIDTTTNISHKAYALGYLAQIYQQENDLDSALALTHKAIFAAQELPEQLYRWEAQQGQLLQRQGKLSAAIRVYQNALSHVHPIRNQLFSGQRNAQYIFEQYIRPVYYELADVLLQQAKQTRNKKQKNTLLVQARHVLEQYKHAELEDYFQDECVLQQEPQYLDNLSEETAVLYPILLEQRMELLLSLPDGIHQVVVDVPREKISQLAKSYQLNLQRRNSWRFLKQSGQLYDWLIRPLIKQLKAADSHTLVIVPDGALRLIPFATLFDGEQYLIENFATAITPSLSLTEPKSLPKKRISILVNGLSESVQKFSALPNVTTEVRNIEKLFPKRKTLLDEGFSLQGVSQALNSVPYSIVHVASHGQFDRNPNKTFLLTHDSKLTMNHLTRLLSVSEARQHPVELLTLSACQTAVGDERAALGLAGVAVKAGARSALASLWFVDDEATSQLVVAFYQQLQNNDVSRAQALQQAQKDMLTQMHFSHPVYWSAFLLIGNWL